MYIDRESHHRVRVWLSTLLGNPPDYTLDIFKKNGTCTFFFTLFIFIDLVNIDIRLFFAKEEHHIVASGINEGDCLGKFYAKLMKIFSQNPEEFWEIARQLKEKSN